jgi:hypothetical protein
VPNSLGPRFTDFAEHECKDSSPLYEALSRAIAGDESMLEIAANTTKGQPVPNLLFASAHSLLLGGIRHALSDYYPSLTSPPRDPAEAFPHFKEFILTHREEIISLLRSRRVQTNEVRRSAYLFPALALAANHFDSRPLALIEIGTSAGLNLLWDKYRYAYGDGKEFGDPSSEVLITSTFRGKTPASLATPMPCISHRIGLDLHIVDATLPAEAAWLRALIWPEHHERRALLDAAVKHRAQFLLDLREGDGFTLLPEIAREIPADTLLCVYHTHVANQISPEARQQFLRAIANIGAQRDLIHLFNNIHPDLHLTVHHSGACVTNRTVAKTDGHARWIEWQAE